MDGPDPSTRPSRALVTRVFEATRLADDLIAAAYDQLLAPTESVGVTRPPSPPRGRRATETDTTPTGGRGQ
jgi:hypothetical protein